MGKSTDDLGGLKHVWSMFYLQFTAHFLGWESPNDWQRPARIRISRVEQRWSGSRRSALWDTSLSRPIHSEQEVILILTSGQVVGYPEKVEGSMISSCGKPKNNLKSLVLACWFLKNTSTWENCVSGAFLSIDYSLLGFVGFQHADSICYNEQHYVVVFFLILCSFGWSPT